MRCSDRAAQFSHAVQARLVCCGPQAQYKLIPVFYFAAWFCCFVLEKTRRHATPTSGLLWTTSTIQIDPRFLFCCVVLLLCLEKDATACDSDRAAQFSHAVQAATPVQPRRSSTSGLLWTKSTPQIDPRFLFCCVVLLLCLGGRRDGMRFRLNDAVQPRRSTTSGLLWTTSTIQIDPRFLFCCVVLLLCLGKDATACDSDWTTQFSNAVQPRLVCCGLQAQYKLIPVFYFAAWFCCFVLKRRDGMRLPTGRTVQPRRSSTSGLLWTTSTIQIDPRFLFCCVVLLLCLGKDATACDFRPNGGTVQPRRSTTSGLLWTTSTIQIDPRFLFCCVVLLLCLGKDATACDSDWTTQFSHAVQPRLVCCGLQAQYKLIPVFYFAAWFCCFVLKKTRRHATPTERRSSATPFKHVWSAVDYKHNTN
jgi:hypothetical protein